MMKKLLIAVLVLLAAGAGFLVWRELSKPATTSAPAATPASAPAAQTPPASQTSSPAPGKPLLWRDASGGENLLWHFDAKGAPVGQPIRRVDAEWTALAFAPGGWDGADMVAWRNNASGEIRLWKLGAEGDEPEAATLPPAGPEWRLAALADVDGDTDADAVWVSDTGGVAVWTLQNGEVSEQGVIGDTGGDWMLAGVGDFGGDGRADLFWRKQDGGAAGVWALDGIAAPATSGIADAGPAWTVIAVAALDERAGEDLLWRDAAGNLAIWSGADPAKPVAVGRMVPPGWNFVAAHDIDGDGRGELLWRSDDHSQFGAWRLGAEGAITDLPLPPVGGEWTPVPAALATR